MTEMPAYRYRPMATDDLEWVMNNERELYPFPWTHGNFADALDAGYFCRVMLDGCGPVGYSVMMLILDEAHLLNLSIVREAQCKGAGGALLGHMRDAARAMRATQFFLEVRPSNAPALHLYEKSGFTSVGRRRAYYPAEGGREDAIVMRVAP